MFASQAEAVDREVVVGGLSEERKGFLSIPFESSCFRFTAAGVAVGSDPTTRTTRLIVLS